MGDQPQSHDSERVGILLKQYEICAMHHLGFYNLIWQVPSVAVAIAGGLASIVFSSDMPWLVRIPMLLMGTSPGNTFLSSGGIPAAAA